MPLADDGGLVAGLAQKLGEGLLAAVEGAGVIGESVLVAVLAGEQAGPAGTADGVGHDVDDVERFAGFLPVCFRSILPASGAYRAGHGHGQDGLYGPFISVHCLFIMFAGIAMIR